MVPAFICSTLGRCGVSFGILSSGKAKDSAEQEYNEVEQEYDNLKSKPNKTPDDKNKLEKLKRSLKRLKDKMDFKGENHSRNAKGNR